MNARIEQHKERADVAEGAEAEDDPAVGGHHEVVVEVEGRHLTLLLPQHEEHRVQQVDVLRNDVDVNIVDDGQRPLAAVLHRRVPRVQHPLHQVARVEEEAGEDVAIVGGQRQVVDEEERFQTEGTLPPGHPPRADPQDEEEVGGEQRSRNADRGHEGVVGGAGVAVLTPEALEEVVEAGEFFWKRKEVGALS